MTEAEKDSAELAMRVHAVIRPMVLGAARSAPPGGETIYWAAILGRVMGTMSGHVGADHARTILADVTTAVDLANEQKRARAH